jgi:3'-phosphoadenosine 5'-phosphosulfate (PAPS) 3'-phosphatase
MRQSSKEDLMQQLLSIARVAGDAIMTVYFCGMSEVQLKKDNSPLTEADLAAQALVI